MNLFDPRVSELISVEGRVKYIGRNELWQRIRKIMNEDPGKAMEIAEALAHVEEMRRNWVLRRDPRKLAELVEKITSVRPEHATLLDFGENLFVLARIGKDAVVLPLPPGMEKKMWNMLLKRASRESSALREKIRMLKRTLEEQLNRLREEKERLLFFKKAFEKTGYRDEVSAMEAQLKELEGKIEEIRERIEMIERI